MIIKLLSKLGVDKAIFYVLLSRGLGSVSSFITLLLISKFLSPVEQGYYYTFASILGLQVVFELGFGSVLVQFVSHEMVGVKITGDGVQGNESNVSRLCYIISLAIKWYVMVSLLVLFIIFPFGCVFFLKSAGNELTTFEWLQPWFFLVLSASVSLVITPILSIAEGCGFVAKIAKLRFFQTVVSAIFAWVFLFAGFGLYATSATSIAIFLVGLFWIKKSFLHVVKMAFVYNHQGVLTGLNIWKEEIFPVQWRIGLSWLCGYFIFQLFNPVAFYFYGPKFAGQMGLSMSVVTLLASLALSWVMTKNPRFGYLIANRSYLELDSLYQDAFKKSLLFLILLVAVSNACVFGLSYTGINLATRLLPPLYFFILSFTSIGLHVIACQATYIRAHKVEKHLGNAILTAVLTVLALAIAVNMTGFAIIVLYFIVVWLFCVPHSTWVWLKYKKDFKLHAIK